MCHVQCIVNISECGCLVIQFEANSTEFVKDIKLGTPITNTMMEQGVVNPFLQAGCS